MDHVAVIATTHIDRHNCKISKEALEQAAYDIKHGNSVPALGIEHDMACPPWGKVTDAWLEPMEDGEFKLLVVQKVFDVCKEINLPDGSIAYEEVSVDDNRPFTLRIDKHAPNKIKIQADYVNFNTPQEFNSLFEDIRNVGEIDQEVMGRKSLIPDPEMVITLAHNFITYLAGKKLLDKTADKLSEDIAKSYDIVKQAVFSMAKYCIPKNRPITYIYEIPGDIGIELIVRTNSPDIAINALTRQKINACFAKVEELKQTIAIDKIQFMLNEIGNWEFNFLCTKTGSVIGTPQSHQRRAQRIQLMRQEAELDKRTIKEPNETTVFLQAALANTGIKKPSDELGTFLKNSMPNIEFQKQPVPPGVIMSAAFDWQAVIGTAADLITLAGVLWAAYEKFIIPRQTEKKNVFIFVRVFNVKNETQIILNSDFKDEEAFTKAFLDNVDKIKQKR